MQDYKLTPGARWTQQPDETHLFDRIVFKKIVLELLNWIYLCIFDWYLSFLKTFNSINTLHNFHLISGHRFFEKLGVNLWFRDTNAFLSVIWLIKVQYKFPNKDYFNYLKLFMLRKDRSFNIDHCCRFKFFSWSFLQKESCSPKFTID